MILGTRDISKELEMSSSQVLVMVVPTLRKQSQDGFCKLQISSDQSEIKVRQWDIARFCLETQNTKKKRKNISLEPH